MACDLRCTNCADNLGKDTENEKVAWCGNCGQYNYNERGESDNLTDEQKQWLKENRTHHVSTRWR